MSSSNQVRLAAIPETTYGVTPATGNFRTLRFTSEGISGTPNTVQSAQIRTDRLASGQIVTGLEVSGDMSFELSRESAIDELIASAMLNDWTTYPLQTVGLTIDATNPDDVRLTRASGSWTADGYVSGQFAALAGFANSRNNTQVMFAALISATEARVIGPRGTMTALVSGTGTTTTIGRSDSISIGTVKRSFSMEKAFLDLSNKAILYRGMTVGSMELNVAFGELVTGSFGLSGNGYGTVSSATDFLTNARVVNPPATTNTLNGSVDMPFLAQSALGTLDSSSLDIQSLNISLDNNLSAQNVIGRIAPKDYSAGTAAIEISMNVYLKDGAWPILAKKLTQESFAIGFQLRNVDGWYAFYLPAVQVSFGDPASGGADQEISLEMTGTAKVSATGGSSLVIYRSTL